MASLKVGITISVPFKVGTNGLLISPLTNPSLKNFCLSNSFLVKSSSNTIPLFSISFNDSFPVSIFLKIVAPPGSFLIIVFTFVIKGTFTLVIGAKTFGAITFTPGGGRLVGTLTGKNVFGSVLLRRSTGTSLLLSSSSLINCSCSSGATENPCPFINTVVPLLTILLGSTNAFNNSFVGTVSPVSLSASKVSINACLWLEIPALLILLNSAESFLLKDLITSGLTSSPTPAPLPSTILLLSWLFEYS